MNRRSASFRWHQFGLRTLLITCVILGIAGAWVVRRVVELGVGRETQWSSVAAIASIDRITQIHVRNLLASKGIDSIMEGSIVWGVSVPKPDADAAAKLLRDDAKKRGYWIGFDNGDVQKATAPAPSRFGCPFQSC